MIREGRLACARLVALIAALAIVGITPAPARAAHSPTGLTATPAGCTSALPAWDSPTGRSLAGWDYQVVGAHAAFQEIAASGTAASAFTVTGLTAAAASHDPFAVPPSGWGIGDQPVSERLHHRRLPHRPRHSINGVDENRPSLHRCAGSGQSFTAATPEDPATAGDPEIRAAAPTCVGGDVDGTAVTLTFSDPLDVTAVPRPAHFTLTADGRSFSPHSIEVSDTRVAMTLHADDAVTIGQSVTVTYHASTNPDERLQDLAGNLVAACSSRPVQNHTTVPWIPVPVDPDWSSNPYDEPWSPQDNPCDQSWSSNPFDTPGSGPGHGQVVCQ